MHKGVINTQFEGDLKRINDVLNKFIEEGAFKHSDQTEIDNYFEAFEKTVLGSLPANMFGANPASVFSQMKKSKRVLPNKGKDKITLKDGEIITINDYFFFEILVFCFADHSITLVEFWLIVKKKN